MSYTKEQIDKLIEACNTPNQREILEAWLELGGSNRVASTLKRDPGSIRRTIRQIKARAAKLGLHPDPELTKPVPDGYKVRGSSTLYRDGEPILHWHKTEPDRERQLELYREAIQAMCEDVTPQAPVPFTEPPHPTSENLVNQYTVTDLHFGMLAWHEETGANWDLKIAESLLVDWFRLAIETSPPARNAILAQLGDLFHHDGLESVTPTSGNALDADSRVQEVVRVVIRVFKQVVTMLLSKYEQVHIVMAEGNHDIYSSVWLRELFASLYENEPRVTVDVSPVPYYSYRHGNVSLFYHHGHKRKPGEVDRVFAARFRDVFGQTQHSYAHMGHQHHDIVTETSIMKVEQHRTLAAPDAHAARGGYNAGRSAKVITYHADHGEVGRLTISPEMVEARRGGVSDDQ